MHSAMSALLYDWRFTANLLVLAPSPLRLTISDFFFHQNPCGHSPYVVYKCFLTSPSQSFSGLRPAELTTIFYCLSLETPPTCRARSSYLCPSVTGWPSYTSSHWVPLSSPPTTRRVTVEVFEPACTRATLL
jgi:hypothetical protein